MPKGRHILPFASTATLAKPRPADAGLPEGELRIALQRHLDHVQVLIAVDPEAILVIEQISRHLRHIALPLQDPQASPPSTPATDVSGQETPDDPVPYRAVR